MSVNEDGYAKRPDRNVKQFFRFCGVGAVGFFVDAAVLSFAIHVMDLGPLTGRFLSFAVAVLVTFDLNRRWSFDGADRISYRRALCSYLTVQGFGFACNFCIYAAAYAFLPHPYNDPLVCLFLASGCALVVNYLGAKFFVFKSSLSI